MHSINNIAKKIQLYSTSYPNLNQAICFQKWKQVSGVFCFFFQVEPADQAERESKALPIEKKRGREGKEKKRSEVFFGGPEEEEEEEEGSRREEEEGGCLGAFTGGLPAVNTAARDQSSSDSADFTALFSEE